MKNKNPKIKRNLLCFPSNNQLFMSSSSSSEVSDLPGQKQYWGCISGCWSSSPASLLSKLLCHSAISHFMEAAAWVTNQGKGVDIITPKIVVPDNFRIRDTSFCWMAKLPRSHLPDLRKGCSLVDCSTCGPGSASSCCLYAASSQWSILLRMVALHFHRQFILEWWCGKHLPAEEAVSRAGAELRTFKDCQKFSQVWGTHLQVFVVQLL